MSESDGHLSAEAIAGYRGRKLAPGRVAEAARHLDVCEDCRAAVLVAGDAAKVAEAFDGESAHLNFEELEALVDAGAGSHPHLAGCEMCAGEVEDLKAFRDSQQKPRRRLGRVLVPAGALVAAGVLALVLGRHREIRRPVEIPTIAALEDGGRTVGLKADGTVAGLDAATPELRRMAGEAMRTGRLPEAANVDDVVRGRETLLSGGAEAAAALRPVIPVGTVVDEVAPEFRWTAAAGAGRFVVSVYTDNFVPVASSGELRQTEWKCTVPLRRGAVYLWTVSGMVRGRRVVAPRSPEPEARFRVAATEASAQMEAVRRMEPRSDLLVAIEAEKLGMFDEADRALGRLGGRNPGSAVAARLGANIRSGK